MFGYIFLFVPTWQTPYKDASMRDASAKMNHTWYDCCRIPEVRCQWRHWKQTGTEIVISWDLVKLTNCKEMAIIWEDSPLRSVEFAFVWLQRSVDEKTKHFVICMDRAKRFPPHVNDITYFPDGPGHDIPTLGSSSSQPQSPQHSRHRRSYGW